MINGRSITSLLFLIVSGLGSLYMLIEALLQANGKSICASAGCKVVAQYSRFGDLSMVLLGFATLSVLALLAAAGMRTVNESRERLVNLALVVALAAEGFLVGYQLLWLSTVCLFCMSVFGIFVLLGILRILAGHREVVAGFATLAALLAFFFLILPAGGPALPAERKLILFFSTDCKHCAEIRKELEDARIEAEHVLVREFSATLKSIGIEHVPTLLVNGPYEKRFLTGTDAIRGYISSCRVPPPSSVRPSGGTAGRTTAPPGQPGLNIFAPPATPEGILNPPTDEGLCKEDAKCE